MSFLISLIDSPTLREKCKQIPFVIFGSLSSLPNEIQIEVIGDTKDALTCLTSVYDLLLHTLKVSSVKHSFVLNKSDLSIDFTNLDYKTISGNFNDKLWRERLFNPVPVVNGLKVLYSVRDKNPRRLDIKSEMKLRNMLSKYNATIINPHVYTLKEQIEIFSHHNCLIGVCGDNMEGVMWMPSESVVFEFIPFVSEQINDCQHMSNALNFRYQGLQAISNHLKSNIVSIDERVLLYLDTQVQTFLRNV